MKIIIILIIILFFCLFAYTCNTMWAVRVQRKKKLACKFPKKKSSCKFSFALNSSCNIVHLLVDYYLSKFSYQIITYSSRLRKNATSDPPFKYCECLKTHFGLKKIQPKIFSILSTHDCFTIIKHTQTFFSVIKAHVRVLSAFQSDFYHWYHHDQEKFLAEKM